MLGNYYFPAASSTESTNNPIYQEQQPDLRACTMDSGHRREPSGSSPSRTPSSPSRHSVKLSIRSLIDSSRVGEDGFDAEGFSFTRSPRHSPQWEGQAEEEREEEAEEEHEGEPIGDANSDEDESMTAMANGQTSLAAASSLLPPMDVGTIIATNSRTHPSLTVRLTLEEPSVEEPTSRPRLRRRRSSTSNTEPGDDKERRKSLRLSRPSSAVEVRIGGKESSSPPIPVTHPQRIRLRSPKRRSPSPRRQGSSTDNLHITSNKRPRMTVQEGASEGEATPRARRSPSPSRKASSLSPSVAGNERRARRRSRSPLRASTEVVPSSSLRSSPMRGTRAESAARVSPKRTSSPSRVNTAAASEVGGSANKIRIRLRPSLEASSTESVNGGTGGGGETVVTRSRKATSDDAIDPKRRSPPKERRPPKRSSSPKGKNGAREASTRYPSFHLTYAKY